MKIILGRSVDQPFSIQNIERLSGQNLFACLQCGKCSSGCPMAEFMDLLPNQVIREAQLGNTAVLAHCNAVWFCSCCFACALRCPKGIDMSRIMEAVRIIQAREFPCTSADPDKEALSSLPQIALISHFRKFRV